METDNEAHSYFTTLDQPELADGSIALGLRVHYHIAVDQSRQFRVCALAVTQPVHVVAGVQVGLDHRVPGVNLEDELL
jgi:hypothetical protein